MHSKIFQVSLTPIEKEDFRGTDDFYENYSSFADYISKNIEGEDRDITIDHLANKFSAIFTRQGDALVYNGKVKNFVRKWYAHIKKCARELSLTKMQDSISLHRIKDAVDCTHLDTSIRFYIEDWNGWAGPAKDLIDFIINKMKKGDKLYVGGVVDYHY